MTNGLANRSRRRMAPLVCALCWLLFSTSESGDALAHDQERPMALRGVALDQKLGAGIPSGLEFYDEVGRRVRFDDYLGRRPVLVALVYYSCEELCPLLVDGIVRALRPLSFDVGRQFDVVAVSIDPRDTPVLAAAKKRDAVKRYARRGTDHGWHFLSGAAPAIHALSEAVGFRYNFDSEKNRFGHAAGILLLTPEGKVARYFYGIEFSPRDLRLGIIEASANRVGTVVDQLLLFCYRYDPATGKYSILVTNLVRSAGFATALALAASIVAALRRESRQSRSANSL